MKVCVLGNGLTSLALSKGLLNLGIYVDLYSNEKKIDLYKSRTLAISKTNIDFFKNNILNIDNLLWNINKIEVYSENLYNKKILGFQNSDKQLFSIIKNFKLNNCLHKSLIKNKLFKIHKPKKINILLNKKYDLVINCEINNIISKKFFYKKLSKDYNSYAHTNIFNHKEIKNDTAVQIFTTKGPLAFLPISKTKTSVVFSARGPKNLDLSSVIKKFNPKYEIISFGKMASFRLKSLDLRNYYHKNILAFGDLLHKVHPLAGQGFNMNIRDIKQLIDLVKSKKELGLNLDNSICKEFEKKNKHKNYLFSNGIDFLYEVFYLESKMKNNFLSNTIKVFGKNKSLNKIIKKFADSGLVL